MASIQIYEMRPVEDQLEELSYDEAGNIIGGSFVDKVLAFTESLVEKGFLTAEQATNAAYAYLFKVGSACKDSPDPNACAASYGVV